MIAMTTTLATLPSPIMPRMSTEQTNVAVTMMLCTPSLFAKNPGESRPAKLHAFRITICRAGCEYEDQRSASVAGGREGDGTE